MPTMHPSRVQEFHYTRYCAACYGWGDHMTCDYVVMLFVALVGLQALGCELVADCYNIQWTDSLGERVS